MILDSYGLQERRSLFVLQRWCCHSTLRKALCAAACIILVMPGLSGCALTPFCAYGRLFDKDQVSRIVAHETTRQEVLAYFGPPLETNDSDASDAGYWGYHYVYLGALSVERSTLEIYFAGDVVSSLELWEDERPY